MKKVIFNAISYDEYLKIVEKIKTFNFEIIKDITSEIVSIDYVDKCLTITVRSMLSKIALHGMNDFCFMSEKEGIEIADYISTLDYNKRKAIIFYINKHNEYKQYAIINNPLRFILQCSEIDDIFINIGRDFVDNSLTVDNYSSIMIEK